MQKKTAIGIVLGVTVVSLVSTFGSMSLVGGGGGPGPGHGGIRSHILCWIWYLTANVIILVELLVCITSCEPMDPTKCFQRCVREFFFKLLILVTVMFACLRFS